MNPHSRIRSALAATVCLGLLLPARGDDEANDVYTDRYRWLLEQFQDDSQTPLAQQERANAAATRVQQEHKATMRALLQVFRSTRSPDKKLQAVRLLGEMRAREAAIPLIDEITLHDPHAWSVQNRLAPYPCVGALIEIGEPAVTHILGYRVGSPVEDQQLKLYAAVVYGYYFRLDVEVGRVHVQRVLEKARQQRAENASDPFFAQRERDLAKLLDYYDAIGRKELFWLIDPPARQ